MDDILGRVMMIFFATLIFVGMPFYYLLERTRLAEQMYLLSVNTEFVDSICTTGVITEDSYQELLREVAVAAGIYEVEILHEQKELVYEEEAYHYVSTYYDEEDMWEALEKGEEYFLRQGDFLKVTFLRKKTPFLLPWEKNDNLPIFYGGTVRYETF